MNLEHMSPDVRRRLLQMACVAAWSDLDVADEERAVVMELAGDLALGDEGVRQARAWLDHAPPEFDPFEIPAKHRETFFEALRAVIEADGRLDPEECETLRLLRELST